MAAKKEAGRARANIAPPPPPAASEPELGLADLARGILSREIKPRVAHVRRLAEAALAGEESGRKKKKDKGEGKRAERKVRKERKLSKIPRPKKKAK